MKLKMKKQLLVGIAALGLAGIAWCGEITGSVSYRERIALPANSVITIRLDDISVAGRAAELVSELRFVTGTRQVPINFRLPYMDSAIQKGRRYQIRASIHTENQLMFASNTAYPVVNNGIKKASIVVQRISPSANLILGIQWKLTELNGKPALPGRSGGPTINFDKGGTKFTSHTGVNSLSGSFKLTGGSINISPGIQTLIGASPELMQQEKDFSAALKATTSYRLVDGKLELLKGSEIVARFEQ
jgi:putative lipoprotein